MTFGESADSFFWQGYYNEIMRTDLYANAGMNDVWEAYCMGGEL